MREGGGPQGTMKRLRARSAIFARQGALPAVPRPTRARRHVVVAWSHGPHASPAAGGGGGASRTSLRLAVAAASNSSSFSLIVATGMSEAFIQVGEGHPALVREARVRRARLEHAEHEVGGARLLGSDACPPHHAQLSSLYTITCHGPPAARLLSITIVVRKSHVCACAGAWF